MGLSSLSHAGLITKGITSARLLTRARILLKAGEGWKDKEIAQALNSSVATIERIRQRFVEGNLEKALQDDPRLGAKCKLDGRAEAQLIALACSKAGRASSDQSGGHAVPHSDQLPNLTLVSHTSSYNPTCDWYEIVGEVRNDHGSRVEYVSPVATLYGPSGAVMGCDFTYISSTHLDPGGSSSFKNLIGENAQLIQAYRIQIDGAPK